MLKRTPLYDLHVELGGKMVSFAGYQMPIHYVKGTIEEHLHCRNQVGFFDVSHMGQALIIGDNTAAELEKLTPSDIVGLKPWQQKYTVLTNKLGGVIDDIIVTQTNLGYMLTINAACKNKVYDHLRQNLSHDCEFIELADQALFAIQGPKAAKVMQNFAPVTAELKFLHSCSTEIADIPCFISRSGYTGEDGFEISVAQQFAERLARLLLNSPNIEPIGLAARNSLRLEAGLCLYGHELSENISLAQANLTWLIKKNHTHFPGAEKILNQLNQGPNKILVGLNVASKIPVRDGAILYNEDTEQVGVVTSGCFSPSLHKPIALAYVDRDYAKPGTLILTQVREHKIYVSVTSLPFLPHHYRK